MDAQVIDDEWEELIGPGVRKKVVFEGAGASPDLGSLVLVNWDGVVIQADGASGYAFAKRSRVTSRIGDGEDIPGLELTLRHMREGQQCLIRCESRFAYGPDGCPSTRPGDKDVPPNTDVEILVELLEVLSKTQLSDMTLDEKLAEGNRKKVVGNDQFARTAYKQALRSYTAACNIIAEVVLPDKESEMFQKVRQLRLDCGNNMATACVRLGEFEKAKEATVDVLRLDPDNMKALFRAGQISSLQSNFVEAKVALRRALNLSPESKEIQDELRRLLVRIKAYNTKRQTVQEAMGKSLLAGSQKQPKVVKGSGGSSGTPVLALQNARKEGKSTEQAVLASRQGGRVKTAVIRIYYFCQSLSGYVVVALAACVVAFFLSQIASTS